MLNIAPYELTKNVVNENAVIKCIPIWLYTEMLEFQLIHISHSFLIHISTGDWQAARAVHRSAGAGAPVHFAGAGVGKLQQNVLRETKL